MTGSGCSSRGVGAAGTPRLVIPIRPPIAIVEPTSRMAAIQAMRQPAGSNREPERLA